MKPSEAVQCPFYVQSSERTILCEGVLPGTRDNIRFEKQKDRTTQLKKYCCGCYQMCERFNPISAKYEE